MRLTLFFLLAASLVAAPPQRIVSTAPSITQTLFAMGLGGRVVGVTNYCDYPTEARKRPKIGTFLKPDIEAISALHPDLVVVQKLPNRLPAQLDRLHIRHIEVDCLSLADIYAMARDIGRAAEAEPAARRLIESMQSQLQEVRTRTQSAARPSVVFLVGHTPGRLEAIIAAAGQSYFTDLLEIAGGANAFGNVAAHYPKISLEEILGRDPDAIVEMVGHERQEKDSVLALWATKRSLRAVASGHVYVVPSEFFVVPGPRAVDAVRYLARLLHPEIAWEKKP